MNSVFAMTFVDLASMSFFFNNKVGKFKLLTALNSVTIFTKNIGTIKHFDIIP